MTRRIAILCNYPIDQVSFTGGVETATAALLEGLHSYSDEFEFHLVSGGSTSLPADTCVQRGGVSFHFIGGLHRAWVRPRMLLRIVKVWRVLRRLNPGLVHCQGDSDLGLAAILAHHRLIMTIHGVATDEARFRTGLEFWSTLAQALIANVVEPKVAAYICNSGYAASVASRGGPLFAIPNAVGSVFVNPPQGSGDATDVPRLVFVGVLARLKRPADLLEAHAALRREFPTLETVLCGPTEDKRYARRLRRFVDEAHVGGVAFLGPVKHDRLVALLRGASALVLPSAQENAPMAIAEAMAIGVPVVATRVGGVPEMVSEGVTGLLYTPGQVPELIACLRRLLGNALLRQRLGRAGREAALARYTPEVVARETVAVYRHMLDGTPAASFRPMIGAAHAASARDTH